MFKRFYMNANQVEIYLSEDMNDRACAMTWSDNFLGVALYKAHRKSQYYIKI